MSLTGLLLLHTNGQHMHDLSASSPHLLFLGVSCHDWQVFAPFTVLTLPRTDCQIMGRGLHKR